MESQTKDLSRTKNAIETLISRETRIVFDLNWTFYLHTMDLLSPLHKMGNFREQNSSH